jgi:uncharacterized protein (DUF2141 family)
MKSVVILLACLILLPGTILAQSASEPASATGTLTVLVTGLKSDKGEVRISLYNSKAAYSGKEGEAFRRAESAITEKQASATFESLPFGEYAIKLFHDRNSNDKLDKLFGIPSEDYAFSNNATGTFGPAKYKKAKFELNQGEMIIEIAIPVHE